MNDAPYSGIEAKRASRGAAEGAPRETIGLREAIALTIGVVVGAGIFKAPSMVADMTGDAAWMFGAWALGGLMSIIGALCYAELATAYSNAGGDYHFLHRAYGRSVSFLFAWARFSVISTGSIALLAFVFGDYMSQIQPLGAFGAGGSSAFYASMAIIVLSWVNMRGIKTGISTQAWLTGVEIGGLLLIVAAALVLSGNGAENAAVAAPRATSEFSLPASFGLAMVFVLLTYGGWNEAAYISAELKDVQRNMVKVLVGALLIITVLYMLVTWAYWKGIGLAGMARSDAIAADLLRLAFGPVGEKMVSVMIAVAAVTSINATMIAGARSSYAAGRHWPVLAKIGRWDQQRGIPANALRVQCIAALLLVSIGSWSGSGFKTMVEFTAPVFWLFFLLSGVSLFVLRVREPDTARPFKVPLFPLLPLLFCAMCVYMLWASLSYVHSKSFGGWNAAWIGVAVLAIGVVLLMLMRMPAARSG